MSSIPSTSAVKFNTLSLTDNFGNSYLFVRTERGFFNIAKCEVLTDGKVPDRDGSVVPNAIPFHDEEVAYLVAEAEARAEKLENIESLLERWIDLRRHRSRKAKRGKLRLQKKEVSK